MAVEVVTLFVKPADEKAFVEGFGAGTEILARQPGWRGMRWGKRVEHELAYMATIDWDSVQDHYNFRETEDYKAFGALFRAYLAKAPEVFHFEPA